MSSAEVPELLHFEFSHFNEKVRWALDLKGTPHRRTPLLPGPHERTIKKLTGQSGTPVLRIPGGCLHGSAEIIDWLEHNGGGAPLYPKDPEERRRALEIQTWFDERIGAQGRLALFFELLPSSRYAARVFSVGHSGFGAACYRAIFPLLVPVMNRKMQIDAPRAEEGRARVLEGLDFVAKQGGDGFLVGNAFSIADLTAASLLYPAVMPEGLHYDIPMPLAPVMERWLERWRDHPGGAWVRRIFRDHRAARVRVKS